MRRDLSWRELCERSWGKELHEPTAAYEFTNRTFYNEVQSGVAEAPTAGAGTSLYADDYADDYA
jgi:hypothetical protein